MTLKSKQCDCAEYRRIESACRDLMAERDEWKRRATHVWTLLTEVMADENDEAAMAHPEAADWFEENGDGV